SRLRPGRVRHLLRRAVPLRAGRGRRRGRRGDGGARGRRPGLPRPPGGPGRESDRPLLRSLRLARERLARPGRVPMIYEATVDGRAFRVEVRAAGGEGRYAVVLDGRPIEVDVRDAGPHLSSLIVEGRSYETALE